MVSELGVAVVGRAADWERAGADDQSPFRSELVDDGPSESTTDSKHGVVDSGRDVRGLRSSETTSAETCRLINTMYCVMSSKKAYQQ